MAPGIPTSELREKLDEIDEVLVRIRQMRHNYYAHLKIDATGVTVFIDEAHTALEILREIFDDIYVAHTKKYWKFSAWDTRDTRRLMEELREYKILEPIADRIFYSATQDEGDPSRYHIPSGLFEKLEGAYDSFKPLRSG